MERELVLLLGYHDNVALAKYRAMTEKKNRSYADFVWLTEVHRLDASKVTEQGRDREQSLGSREDIRRPRRQAIHPNCG